MTLLRNVACARAVPRRLLALVALLIGVLPAAASAQEDDLDQQRQQVQAQQAGLNTSIDATRATDEEVSAALSSASNELDVQRFRVEDTEQAAASAEATLARARDEVRAAQARMEEAKTTLRDAAVSSYVRPPADARMDTLFTTDLQQGVRRDALARTAVRSSRDALDALHAAEEDLTRAERQAARAEEDAHAQHIDAELRLADLGLAYAHQADLVADVADRLDHLLSEAAGLSARDAQLAAQLTQRQAALAAQAAAAVQAADQARHEHPAATAASAQTPTVSASRSGGNVALATVRGIEVNAEIADQLARMLAAADADDIYLDGGGWRSPNDQIAIRMEVCGTSDYAIWEMPSWECSPPAARPGRSMHEQGLAIDFTAGRDLIRSRSHPAYRWLDANAERFGFYNLPSEPWHWSTTGS